MCTLRFVQTVECSQNAANNVQIGENVFRAKINWDRNFKIRYANTKRNQLKKKKKTFFKKNSTTDRKPQHGRSAFGTNI